MESKAESQSGPREENDPRGWVAVGSAGDELPDVDAILDEVGALKPDVVGQ